MANKSNKDNKNLIIGICCAIAAIVVVIVIAVALATRGATLNDDYFVSDGTKYVLTIEAEESDEEDEYAPLKTHLVYTYDGDTVTGMKTYYVYADNASAKKSFDALKAELEGEEEASSIELSGKYIIITSDEESYKDLTASDVKQQIEFMETLKNMDTSDLETTEVEETTEAEADEE